VTATRLDGQRRIAGRRGTRALRRALGAALLAALPATLAGCVTINIYFPAAAAEQAADKIIDEVWQLDQKRGTPGDKPAAN